VSGSPALRSAGGSCSPRASEPLVPADDPPMRRGWAMVRV